MISEPASFQVPPPLIEYSTLPPSIVFLVIKKCLKDNTERDPAVNPAAPDIRLKSLLVLLLAANHDVVGLVERTVLVTQLVVPVVITEAKPPVVLPSLLSSMF